MLILNATEVRKALPMREAIEAMKRAYADLSAGRAEVPLRGRLRVEPHDGLSLFMPAFVNDPDGESLAVKVVSLFPGNPSRGLAYIQAAVLVLEPDTGRPIGLLEGSALTAIRTGAASGAAIDLLSRPESHNLAVFGAGAQGRTQIEAACAVRDIGMVWIYDPNEEGAHRLAADMAGTGSVPNDVRVAISARQALAAADLICTATTSTTPVFWDTDVRPGTHISAVGSYTPDMQEVPAETVRRARVFVDSRAATLAETGDLIQPIRAGQFGPEHIAAELGELVLGRVPGRESADQVTLFKSVGIAVQDAAAAGLAIRNAGTLGIGQEVRF
jgi:ornithine cyclodeaminase